MNSHPIFIHALFRTGSTYMWNKFRGVGNTHCYYEPLHHYLLEIDKDYTKNFIKREPIEDEMQGAKRHYLYEYEDLLKEKFKGLPFFKKKFIFDEYCKIKDNPDLKNYIDHLIVNAGDRQPVFQFNRTAFRACWFKHNYPGALQIYLVRNPRDQWESYLLKSKANRNIFMVMSLMIPSLNLDCEYFSLLRKYIPLFEYHNDNFEWERKFYHLIKDVYSISEKYFIFYWIWLIAFIENVLSENLIVNINRLSRDTAYRENTATTINNYLEDGLEFSDARISTYQDYTIPIEQMEEIEYSVQEIVFGFIGKEKTTRFFSSMKQVDQDRFNIFHGETHREVRISFDGLFADVLNDNKFKEVTLLLFNQLNGVILNYQGQIEKCQSLLESKQKEVGELKNLIQGRYQQVENIYNSYTYKLGNFFLFPLKFLKKFISRK